ncbi:MAG: hypothetical protein ACLVD8_26055 [Enterocloster sp.]|uniref:hypothetical protein n=1 Tax=Enterocloster sp. TaxID=2719315 RepID=UPI00399BE21C
MNTMTSDVGSYEKILTHSSGNITKNAVLAAMLVVSVCKVYLPAGLILFLVVAGLIPNLWLSFRVVAKYGVAKHEVSAETVQQHRGVHRRHPDLPCLSYGWSPESGHYRGDAEVQPGVLSVRGKGASLIGFGVLTFSAGAVCRPSWRWQPGPWAAGTLSNVDYLMVSMLPILLTKLTTAISIDLFEWKHLMVSKNNILQVHGGTGGERFHGALPSC